MKARKIYSPESYKCDPQAESSQVKPRLYWEKTATGREETEEKDIIKEHGHKRLGNNRHKHVRSSNRQNTLALKSRPRKVYIVGWLLVNAGQVYLVSHGRAEQNCPLGKNTWRGGRGSRSTESKRTGKKNKKTKKRASKNINQEVRILEYNHKLNHVIIEIKYWPWKVFWHAHGSCCCLKSVAVSVLK